MSSDSHDNPAPEDACSVCHHARMCHLNGTGKYLVCMCCPKSAPLFSLSHHGFINSDGGEGERGLSDVTAGRWAIALSLIQDAEIEPIRGGKDDGAFRLSGMNASGTRIAMSERPLLEAILGVGVVVRRYGE